MIPMVTCITVRNVLPAPDPDRHPGAPAAATGVVPDTPRQTASGMLGTQEVHVTEADPDPAPAPGAAPLQRLVLLTAVLSAAGSRGVAALPLAERLGYGGTAESRRESLARDVRKLRRSGIEIENVASPGEESRWVLRPQDSRIRLALSNEQLAELQRAAWLADRGAIAQRLGAAPPAGPPADVSVRAGGAPPWLEDVTRAVAARCVLRFTYNGRAREVHPHALQSDQAGWALTGWDAERTETRTYWVARMSNVELGAPRSATAASAAGTRGGDPLTWHLDPPLPAQLSGPARYEPEVRRLLGAELGVRPGAGDTVRYETVVTNRWIFAARVMELGQRVRLDGPDELRTDLARRLHAAIEVAS